MTRTLYLATAAALGYGLIVGAVLAFTLLRRVR